MTLLISIIVLVVSWGVSTAFRRKMRKYAQIGYSQGLSGREIAERMLHAHGIADVRIEAVKGRLTDHYNPTLRTVNLSPEIYEGRSIASVAVAAHECGHAIQHAKAYNMLKLRTALVPLQSISARILNSIMMFLMFGFFLGQGIVNYQLLLLVMIAAYAVFTLFAFVTLPVEFDASRRALQWMNQQGLSTQEQHMASDALRGAAMTYVIAALGSLAMLIHYIMLFLSARE